MQPQHPRYFKFNDKIYKVIKNGVIDEVTVLNATNGAFEHQIDVRAFDIEMRGIEVSSEEVLRKIR